MANAPLVEVNVAQRFSNKNRMTVEPIPAWQVKQELESRPLYVYNVSKHDRWVKNVPGMGKVTIQKCPEDREYSIPVVVKGMVRSYFDKGDRKKGYHYDEGIHVAKDLVGNVTDAGADPTHPTAIMQAQNNLENFGVFIAEKRLHDDPGTKPGDLVYTKAESEALKKQANKELQKKNRQHVAQADAFWRGDHRQRSYICQRHQEAALALKLKREWCAAAIDEGPSMVLCDGCGNEVRSTAAFCGTCKMVNNEEVCKRKKLRVIDGFVVIGGQAGAKKVSKPKADAEVMAEE